MIRFLSLYTINLYPSNVFKMHSQIIISKFLWRPDPNSVNINRDPKLCYISLADFSKSNVKLFWWHTVDILSVPKFTANLYSIYLSIQYRFAVHFGTLSIGKKGHWAPLYRNQSPKIFTINHSINKAYNNCVYVLRSNILLSTRLDLLC